MSLETTLTALQNARGAIVDAIGSKGVTLPSSATLLSCASAVLTISQGSGGTDVSDTTAEAADVLSGKVFYNSGGTLTSGAIATVSASIESDSVIVPVGYIAVSQTFPISSGSGGVDVSDTTAEAANVQSGYYFYTSAGVKTEGTLTVSGGIDVSDTTATAAMVLSGAVFHDSTGAVTTGTIPTVSATLAANVATVPAGYIATSQTLTVPEAGAVTVSGNVVTIPVGYISASRTVSAGTDVSATTADSSDVLSGKIFFTSGGVQTSGTIPTVSASLVSGAVVVPSGYVASSQTFPVSSGADAVLLGYVDSNGYFQPLTFSGTTAYDSGFPEIVSSYYTWNTPESGSSGSSSITPGSTVVYSSGGSVVSGGTMTGQTFSGGLLTVSFGGLTSQMHLYDITVDVRNGGAAINTFLTAESGGNANLDVRSGGTAYGAVLQTNTGGTADLTASKGAQAAEVIAHSGAVVKVLSGGTVTNVTLKYSGGMVVSASGSADSVTVSSGGVLWIYEPANVTNLTSMTGAVVSHFV